ncbi:MAG: hypothetical protein REI95_10490 [Oxalicibacterium faecigallinarum]|uniref:Uncharacterized protein n=1 Tax=Oxalicibacterium faecigallinarum TaxID=573741 RepID=A0A8J3EYP9_9BURK|nr:hypothetical protein [Oxalicibacterium faecigallinarum]MDQ7970061.1 hypothetical protein [Oxalicibacterium faecigallinarum]GGI16220.1 hypothetical protein GCM10008066_02870 [Oxalicibacterium faecigallinarum]
MDLIEKFDAKGKTGAGYHVEVYQDDEGTLPRVKSYKLKDGRSLEPLSDAKFRIVQTGEKIYRL